MNKIWLGHPQNILKFRNQIHNLESVPRLSASEGAPAKARQRRRASEGAPAQARQRRRASEGAGALAKAR